MPNRMVWTSRAANSAVVCMSAAGLIIILSVGLAIYGNATFTAADKAEGIQSKKGWQEFNGGFTIGAFGGAAFAYFLLTFVK